MKEIPVPDEITKPVDQKNIKFSNPDDDLKRIRAAAKLKQ